MYDVSDAAVSKGRAQIESVFKKSVELGKATAADADASLARLSATTDLAAALAGTDFVIEAAPEKIDLKLDLMAAIDRHDGFVAEIAARGMVGRGSEDGDFSMIGGRAAG